MPRPTSRAFRALSLTALAVAGVAPAVARDTRDARDAPRFTVELEKLGTYASGVFNQGGAEISAYDPGSRRLFVVNGNTAAPRIDVIDLRRPKTPTLLTSIDVTLYGGAANSVAVSGRTVAVAIQAAVKTDAGKVVFFDVKGNFLSQVTVGALPDMLTFTPDGKRVLVCNEGEPSDDYAVDPEGSVSVIDIPKKNAKKVTQANVTTLGFAAFQGTPLDPSVRVYGPGTPTVPASFEPEYLAVSKDGKKAWVTIQEANALAIVDLATKQITSVVGLGFKDHGEISTSLASHTFPELPVLGTTTGGTVIRLGGFSGLLFEGRDAATGKLRFLTHTDRGPNAEPVDTTSDGIKDRPFALPAFQPLWVRFEADPATGTIVVTDEIGLTRKDGSPLTGLSNLGGTNGLAHSDEPPVDANGQPLALDPLGADLEGIVKAPDGTYWMCDEYRPSFFHFDATGKLIERYVPVGSGAATGVEALPAILAQRRANRGFEGLALQGTKLYGFVQSPVDNPDVANDANSKASRVLRIVEFDTTTFATTAQYAYVHEAGSDKIGDVAAIGPNEFLVVERDDLTGTAANKKVWRVSIAGATKLSQEQSDTLETSPPTTLPSGVKPALKTLYVDLAVAGYHAVDKVEGLALVDTGTIALLNDNDFALDGTLDPVAGTVGLKASSPTVLGLLDVKTQGIDASDRDGGINIRPWPVKGIWSPDTIATVRTKGKNGQDYLLMANEGDTRVWGTFNEEARVKDVTLDPTAFPSGALLRGDANLGRLTISNTLGDTDNDGDFDELYVPGGRSFTVRNAAGALVWDSGEEIERVVAERYPADFNANNDANATLDNRSDNKGPEPEGLAVGEAFGRTYAFVGLERVGGVMVYDVTDPTAPAFIDYTNARDFAGDAAAGTAGDLGPEGVLFVAASKSPTRRPLVIVTNEISGTTTIFELKRVAKRRGE